MGDALVRADPAPLSPAPTPGGRLWRRYLGAKGARAGLVLVALFALAAFLAPFLAHRFPYYWVDAATGERSFPLIREFLSPSDTTEPALEKGINFLFLFIPLAIAAWRLMSRYAPRLSAAESRPVSLLLGALFSSFLWFAIGGMVIQGGGRDWFRSEAPPVPEADDIDNPAAAGAADGVGENAMLLRAVMRERGFPPPAAGSGGMAGADDSRRRLIAPLQALIEGPPIAKPGDAAAAGADPMDITAANLGHGTNTPRWNRILVEAAYPGLLPPFRTVRAAFLLLAAASLVVLAGLTYIFMAGANQFALSPRWLVLLALAALLAIPFRHPPRHDYAEYRALAAAGAGRGVFPPVPYGPNEQGFGPLLPPFWSRPAYRLAVEDVTSWPGLAALLERPADPAAARVAELLAGELPDWRDRAMREAGREDGRRDVVAALNRLVDSPGFFDAAAFAGVRRGINSVPYWREADAGRALAPPHRGRFNRILLEQALPSAVRPADAGQWKKPGAVAGPNLLGTDESGRDVLVRILHGARVSLSVGFVSVFLATVIGLVLGALAAYYAGWTDMIISRFIEVMMCFPSFFLILAVIAVLDRRSTVTIPLVIGLTGWTGVARLIRGEMLRQKRMDYVAASVALGAPDTRTIFRHILPNAMAPVLVSISFGITGAILTEASLSFIGFGVTPPTPTWGQLLSETRDSPLANWWLALFPGIVLFLGVLAYNLVGEALRDALDPRETL